MKRSYKTPNKFVMETKQPSLEYARYLQYLNKNGKLSADEINENNEIISCIQGQQFELQFYDRFLMGRPVLLNTLRKEEANRMIQLMTYPSKLYLAIHDFAQNNGLLEVNTDRIY